MELPGTKIRYSRILAFTLGFVGVLIIMTLTSIGIRPASFIKTLIREEQKQESPIEKVNKKLNLIKNDFKLYGKARIFPQVYAEFGFNNARAYAAADFETGEVLMQNGLNEQLPIASLTKIMTAVTALDLAKEQDQFVISENAASQIPTKIGVVSGQKMKLSELLHALLLTSANDAAEVIEEGVNNIYGENIFIEAMNLKAKALGLQDSNFQNPQGFDSKKNFSTVHDLIVLTHYALLNYPLINEIVKKDYEFLAADQNHKQFDLYNWNGLVGVYPDVRGVKIGNTSRAGRTTVVVSEREGKEIIAVILGAPGVVERDLWAAQLLDASYLEAFGLDPVGVTEEDLMAKYGTWRYWN